MRKKNWLGLGCEEGRNRLSPKGCYDYKNNKQKKYFYKNFIPSGFTNIDLINLFEQKTKYWLDLGREEERIRKAQRVDMIIENNKQKK